MRARLALAVSAIGLALGAPACAHAQSPRLYAGTQAGYDFGDADVAVPAYPSRFEASGSGALAGLFAGAGVSIDDHWTAAVEIDANWAGAGARQASGGGTSSAPEFYIADERWNAGVRVHIGYEIGQGAQIFVAAGPSWARLQTRFDPRAGGSDSATVSGWSAALGGDRQLNSRWFVRGEVRYSRYDTGRFSHLGPSRVDWSSTSLLAGAGYRW